MEVMSKAFAAVRRAAQALDPSQSRSSAVRRWSHAPPVFKASPSFSFFRFFPQNFFTKFPTKTITNFTFASFL